jgi:hypothetical protein
VAMEPVVVRARDGLKLVGYLSPHARSMVEASQLVERAAAFDRGIAVGQLPPPVQVKIEVDPEFNSIDALLAAAQMALTKAMKAVEANPVVTRPGDV